MDFSACTDFPETKYRMINSPKVYRISPKITKTNITFPYIGSLNNEVVTKLNEEFFRVNLGYVKPDARKYLKNTILTSTMPPLYSPPRVKLKKSEEMETSFSPDISFKYSEGSRLKIGKYHHRCQTANDLEEMSEYKESRNQNIIKKFKVIRRELLPQTKAYELNKCESPFIGLKIKGIMKNFTTRKKVKKL